MVESTAKLRSEILALSGVDIMENANEFKSTYKIMDELAAKWENLTDIQQATVTELIAGKRQGNIVSSLMTNFDTARDALETSLGSEGSALEEHAKYAESLEFKLNSLKASWQSFAQTFMNSDTLKAGIDALSGLVDILEKVIDNFGLLGTVGLGVAGKNIFSYFKGAKEAKKTITDVANGIEHLTEVVQNSTNATNAAAQANEKNAASEMMEAEANTASASAEITETQANIASVATEATEAEANATSASSELAETEANLASVASEAAETEANLASTASELAEAEANATSASSELAETTSSVTSAAAEAAETMTNLSGAAATAGASAIKAAGGFKAFFGTLGGKIAIAGAVIAVIGLVINAIKKANEEAAALRQETIESSDEFLNAADSFEQAYIKYSGKTDLTVEEEAELEAAIQGTVDALGNKSSALQNVVNNSNDYIASLEAIKDAELEAAERAAKEKKTAAEKELIRAAIGDAKFDGSEVDVSLGYVRNKGDNVNSNEARIANKIFGSEDIAYTSKGNNNQYLAEITLDSKANTKEIIDYYYKLVEYKDALIDAELTESSVYNQVTKSIEAMSEAVATYESGVYDAAKAQYQFDNSIPKTVGEYLKMRETLLRDEEGEYGIQGLSFDTKNAIANSLDSEYGQVFDLSSAKIQARKFIGLIKGYGDGTIDGTNEIGTVETFLNMRTAVNNNECSVGEYLAQFDEIDKMTANWSDEEKELLNTSLSLDTDTIKAQYEEMEQYLQRKVKVDIPSSKGSKENRRFILEEQKGQIEEANSQIQEFLNSLTADELAAVIDIRTEIDWENTSAEDIRKQIEDRVKLNEAMNFTIAIDVETEGIEALNTALAESKSATGLTAESIEMLKSRYEDLDGYNVATLFEETANGIRVNSTELAKLENEYKNLNKQEADKTLEVLVDNYNDLTKEINNCSDASKRADLYAQRDAIRDQINDVATLAAQFEGLTSAFNEWQSAQSAGQDRDMYESIISGREEIKDEMSRGWLDDATVEYLELLTGKELSTAGIDAQTAAYKKLNDTIGDSGYSIWDFFTEDEDGNATSDGIFNFFDTVKSVAGETAAWVDENGKYHFDFEGFEHNGKIGDAAIAEVLGTSEELVQIILKAAEDAGFVVNIKGDYTDLANLKDEAEVVNDRMKELGATTYTFNFDSTDIKDLNKQIDEAETMLSNLKNKDGTLKVGVSEEDYRKAQDMIAALIYQKQSLDDSAVLHVDTSQAKSDIEKAVLKLQEFKQYANTLELETAIGADTTEATKNIQSVLEYINGLDANIKAGLGLDTTEVQTAIDSVQANIKAGVAIKQEDIDVVNAAISSISNEAMVNLGLDTTLIDNYKSVEQTAEGVVNWSNNIEKVTAWINQTHEASGTVKWSNNTENVKTTFFGNGVINWTVSEANGTANANGTAFADGTINGKAFKQGDWGIKGSGVALGGEVGTEILVRDGRWYTIGDNGAEFFRYRQGDIIFNHKQTEELFANGKITSDGGRGKALLSGTAFASGSNALGAGRNSISGLVPEEKTKTKTETETKVKSDDNGVTVENTTTVGSNGSGGSKNQISDSIDKTDTKDKFEETFDWIAIAIERIEREIDNLDQTVGNVYKSWGDRNTALASEITKVGEEITLQDEAAKKYLTEANSLGLDEIYSDITDVNGNLLSYAQLIQNGTLNLEDFKGEKDEALVEKIKEYQKWYNLYLDCTDAAEDLKQTEAELYAQRFENVQSRYDGILQGFEHTESMLDEYISQAEAKGYIVSKSYYDALIKNKDAEVEALEEEQSKLIYERNEYFKKQVEEYLKSHEDATRAQAEAAIEDSQQWRDMCAEIDGVTQSIEAAETQIIEWNNAMRDIDWQVFDLIQERISDVIEETNFLIDLMSYDKLFDDNGKLTDKGMATMGLHGQNYNTYMYQADDYGAKVKEIDDKIAAGELDGDSRDVIDKRKEYLELQREAILNAEQEKQAIKDLVEEGINLELDALQERIDLHNEELDSMKDLYDYQKNVEEQTKNIASLQKQLYAYEGFDDEETRATVQKLKVELESAQQDLEETEFDRYISQQEELLSSLYEEYELTLNTRLDDVDGLISQVVDGINTAFGAEGGTITSALGADGAIASALAANAASIGNTLKTEAEAVGTKLSTAMDDIWRADGSGKAVLDLYGKDFQGKHTTTNDALNSIKTDVATMVGHINEEAQEKVEQPKTQPAAKADPTGGSGGGSKGNGGSKGGNKSTGGDGKIKIGDKVKFLSGKYYYDSQGVNPAGSKNHGKQVYITNINKKSWATHPYHISTGKKLGSGDLGWLKLNQLSGYATGKKNFLDNEIAWTQENGQEFIVRPSDGAILTPIAKGDSVLTSAASSNIWDMANSPTEFIKDNLNFGSANVPNNSNVQSSIVQNFENITFSMPNVHGYNELLREMQRDPKFEKLILSMTVEQIAGKSSLAKNKSIR